MSFLIPAAGLLGLLAVPIVLLYMLRLRRRETEVSSTYLWSQVLRDHEANAPWQRLRRSLLLLLQLLVVGLLVLALMRPFILTPTVTTGRTVILLDASASMNATDALPSRWEAAQREALDIVDALSPTDSVTVIRAAAVPEVLASASSDPALLRSVILDAEPSQGPADWPAALTLAAGGAAGAENFSVVLISDGGLPANLPAIPGSLRYVPIGHSGENAGITALSARARAGQPPQVFIELTNFGDQDVETILSIKLDGELDRAARMTIPARSAAVSFFTDLQTGFTTLEAGLTPASTSRVPDYLAVDDTAWAVYNAPGAGRVLLMTPGNIYLRQALTSLPDLEAYEGRLQDGLPTDQRFDLYVLDSWLPEDGVLPDGDLLIINPPADTDLFVRAGISVATGNPRVRRDDPRTQYLNFNNVNVLDFTVLEGVAWAEPLVTVDGGPLVLAGEEGGRQVAIITFDLHDSDLPLQIAWPVLLANLMQWYTPARAVSQEALPIGGTLALTPSFEADAVRVTRPDGRTTTLRVGEGPLIYADTTLPGLYTVDTYAGAELLQSELFAVNLFDRAESLIRPAGRLTIGADEVGEAGREEIGQRELWMLLALLALAALSVEWAVYWRRMRLPRPAAPARAAPRPAAMRPGRWWAPRRR